MAFKYMKKISNKNFKIIDFAIVLLSQYNYKYLFGWHSNGS
jgi:hypothetical protein